MRIAIGIALLAVSAWAVAKEPDLLPPPPPLPADWQDISTMLIKQSVRDAETVRIEFREHPYVMTCKKGVFKNSSPVQILMVNVWVNGQNAYGGYTGFEPWSVAFTSSETISYTKADGGALSRFGLCKRSRS